MGIIVTILGFTAWNKADELESEAEIFKDMVSSSFATYYHY
jgi:hypothetical protein